MDEVADERFRPDASLHAAERERRSARVKQVWDAFVETLSGEDRLIWALHFDDQVKSTGIAQALGCTVQHVYVRVDRIKALARRHFARAGVTPADLRQGGEAE